MESQIRFTVKEWRQKICGKKSSEDLKKEKGAMNTADVYGRNRFTFFIDLRSMRDSDLHGSGLRLLNTKEGIKLAINRKAWGPGNVIGHIFFLSDALLNIVNRQLESVTY